MVLSLLIILLVQQEKNGGEAPSFKGYKMMIVLSGSMRPTFDTGALLVVKRVDPQTITRGEIITYQDTEDTRRLITHRVIQVVREGEQTFFVTKGDANETRDFAPVPEQNVVGRVNLSIPYLGYVIEFSHSRLGWALFIFLPVLLAIAGEFWVIYQLSGGEKTVKKMN